jgi:hypothetical protein
MANCEDVTIVIRNETGVEIRATKFEYMDGSRSKTENIFFGGSDTFDPGEDRDYGPRNLEGIGNENTTFTVTYQHRSGSNNWGTNRVHTTGNVHCDDNDRITVTLTD